MEANRRLWWTDRRERKKVPSNAEFSPSSHKWIVKLDGGPRRVNHAAVKVRDVIFSFGGFCTGEDYTLARPIDVFVLNTHNFRWTTLPPPPDMKEVPFQRYGHTVVAYGDHVYLWGGRNDKGACNKLYSFDTKKLTWSLVAATGYMPGARDGHSACVIKDHMYVFAGYEEEPDRFSNDVFSLDLKTFHWTAVNTLGTSPSHRDFHSATAIGDRMYVFGGRGDTQGPIHSQQDVYCNRLAYLDTGTCRWNYPLVSGTPPSGRRSHSSFAYRGELYIFGGYNSRLRNHYGTMYKFNPDNNIWSEVVMNVGRVGPPCPRRRQISIIVGDRLFIFGGTSPSQKNSFNEYDTNRRDMADHMDFEALVDHSDLYVLDFRPSLRTLCITAVLEQRVNTRGLPLQIQMELHNMVTNNQQSRPLNNNG